ncbi:MAG TPA: hypothetical protein PK028_02870 [Bacteroidales bacterium]|jgi:hypothetical protein|nr:hypothetical protein [Bacteroidales bacterium]MDI9573408.1 hypothetical protein [Bacteroidota bacterium]OQC60786.1 MAG: hypothetical protein BWX51_00832 [Bacteroidetes bacterium ADurb.Bin012]MBP9511426.1 hypothetical protein [Bacteroidales bacterium]MBP9587945.1 hypothetical protein [Bacteroidales bacterium]
MEQNSLKKKIYEVAVETLESAAERTRLAIEEAIQAAQEEVNTLDIYESYRSQYLQKSEMFVSQYNKILEQLDILRKINPEEESQNIEFGSIVITDRQKIFVAVGLGKIKVNGDTWFVISPQVPIFEAMKGKKAGDEFIFNNIKHKILQVS